MNSVKGKRRRAGLRGDVAMQDLTPFPRRQLELLSTGDFVGFWESRWQVNKDPVARTALIGWGDSQQQDSVGATFVEKSAAKYTWTRLEMYIATEGLNVAMEDIGLELAVAHVQSVNADKTGVIGLLNPRQVAEYHWDVFAEHSIPKYIFGGSQGVGTPVGDVMIEPEVYSFMWCTGCDTR